jgi:hypothetical protein
MVIKQREEGRRGLYIGVQPGARGWAAQSGGTKKGVRVKVKTHVCRAARAAYPKGAARRGVVTSADHSVSRRLQGDVGDAAAVRAV